MFTASPHQRLERCNGWIVAGDCSNCNNSVGLVVKVRPKKEFKLETSVGLEQKTRYSGNEMICPFRELRVYLTFREYTKPGEMLAEK